MERAGRRWNACYAMHNPQVESPQDISRKIRL
jgi:hypothetical protein